MGAMWLQVRNFIFGEVALDESGHCEETFPKTRRNRDYCDDVCNGRARAARQYERKKQRQREAREATRRRLRR